MKLFAITTINVQCETAERLLSWCTRQRIAACYTTVPGDRSARFLVERHNRNRVVAKAAEIEGWNTLRLITWPQLKQMSRRGRERITRRVIEVHHDGYIINSRG